MVVVDSVVPGSAADKANIRKVSLTSHAARSGKHRTLKVSVVMWGLIITATVVQVT